MPTLTHNAIKLAFEDRGVGKPVLLFVHGWSCDQTFFAPQVAFFSKHHRTLTVDLRGHGQSDKPAGSYSIPTFGADLAHLIEELSLAPVVVVGHSLGGLVALQLCAAYPSLVQALIMIDPAAFVRSADNLGHYQALVQACESGDRSLVEEFITTRMFIPTSDPALVAASLAKMMTTPNHVAATAMKEGLAFDALDATRHCTAPTLHIGASTPRNPPEMMAQWIPHVVNRQVTNAGHFCHLEAPDQVNSMIEDFLTHHVPHQQQQ